MPKKTILIVEDESLSAISLASYLEDLGHRVLDFPTTGREAIAIAEADRPDIVFMDVSLPGDMDGIEAARIINERAPVALIFMTGYANKSVTERAADLKPVAYLIKPFDFALIDGILDSIG